MDGYAVTWGYSDWDNDQALEQVITIHGNPFATKTFFTIHVLPKVKVITPMKITAIARNQGNSDLGRGYACDNQDQDICLGVKQIVGLNVQNYAVDPCPPCGANPACDNLGNCPVDYQCTSNCCTCITPCDGQGICAFKAKSLGRGWSHSCAVVANKTVKCWGRNKWGQLGDGTTTDRLVPVAVGGINDAVELEIGGHQTCVRLSDDRVKCWGYNKYGELGINTTVNSSVAVSVWSAPLVVSIAAGEEHTCAAMDNGTLRCWGENGEGQVGDGTTTDRLSPITVAEITDAAQVSAGFNHSKTPPSRARAKTGLARRAGQKERKRCKIASLNTASLFCSRAQ